MVIFGLFHGLVYLPVILSWVGPAPYDTAEPVKKSRENTPERNAGELESNLLDSEENAEKTTVHMNGFIKVKCMFIVSCKLNKRKKVVANSLAGSIRKTCPCNEYPLKPHFYIVKVGYAGVYLFFLFLLQNIDCGYSLEPPRRGGSNVYPQSVF